MHGLPHLASHSDFDASRLAEAKARLGLTASVCLPARDEAATVGAIVETIRTELVEAVPLVDELIVMDDGSSDRTAAAAAEAGATVFSTADVLADSGPGSGKGDALWKSLYASSGDIVCWIDADIRGFGSHFVSGLLGPLLTRQNVAFVKGCYRRPLDGGLDGGGRVTELMARPLLSRLFPSLAGIVQPLAGEYAGLRSVLETVPFVEGWGVDLALIVDIAHRYGIAAIDQVDLGVRRHRNRSLTDLAPQAMAVLTAALRRAGISDRDGFGDDLVAFDGDLRMVTVDVELRERPPLITLPAYRAKFGRELTA
jgi:glucosyl-3-phosphoglycerate synthase